MKKIIVISCMLISMISTLHAQELEFGVLAGVNTNTAEFRGTATGFDLGVKSELGLPYVTKGLYINVAVELSLLKEGTTTEYYNSTIENSPYFVNIPIHVGYKFRVGNKINLFVNAGPYMGYGLWGKQMRNLTSSKGLSTETSSTNVFKDNITKRFDWGVGLNAGLEFARHYQLSVSYDWGLENLKGNKSTLNDKHKVFRVTASYMF